MKIKELERKSITKKNYEEILLDCTPWKVDSTGTQLYLNKDHNLVTKIINNKVIIIGKTNNKTTKNVEKLNVNDIKRIENIELKSYLDKQYI